MRPAFKEPVWTDDYCRGRASEKEKDVTGCPNVPVFFSYFFPGELVHRANTGKKKKENPQKN